MKVAKKGVSIGRLVVKSATVSPANVAEKVDVKLPIFVPRFVSSTKPSTFKAATAPPGVLNRVYGPKLPAGIWVAHNCKFEPPAAKDYERVEETDRTRSRKK